ncbi:hypothetical protein AOLI_G00270840 [Acnodon oligacanthus]
MPLPALHTETTISQLDEGYSICLIRAHYYKKQCSRNGMDGRQVSSMSQWLNSDVFIVFVVVLVLFVVAVFAVCWVIRCRRTQTQTERMAEIEIVPAAGSDRSGQHRFTLKIVTEQKHASELVQILTNHTRLKENTECSADQLGPEVASREKPPSQTLSNPHSITENTLPNGQQATILDNPTTYPNKICVAATIEPLRPDSAVNDDVGLNDDAADDCDDETSQYSSAGSSRLSCHELNRGQCVSN